MSRLEEILTSSPASIDWPEPTPQLSSRVVARLQPSTSRPASRRWVPAVAAMLVMAIAIIPGARQAVADLIVEAGVRIGVIDETPGPGANLDLGDPVSMDEARSAVDFAISIPSSLGEPEAVYVGEERVSMIWGRKPPSSGRSRNRCRCAINSDPLW
ncbi:MAG TPA: hypothetical protein VE569_11555 [Acidimicrobiia bacterium]|nr:hypothetical protein [Acidimicrobiia bacterium]